VSFSVRASSGPAPTAPPSLRRPCHRFARARRLAPCRTSRQGCQGPPSNISAEADAFIELTRWTANPTPSSAASASSQLGFRIGWHALRYSEGRAGRRLLTRPSHPAQGVPPDASRKGESSASSQLGFRVGWHALRYSLKFYHIRTAGCHENHGLSHL